MLTAEFQSLTIGKETQTTAQRAISAAAAAPATTAAPAAPTPKNFAPAKPWFHPSGGAAAAIESCCWCDKTTPEEATAITGPTDGKAYQLVFSDEFSTPGRSFENGADAKWTALAVGDTANQGVAFYLPEQATVELDAKADKEETPPSALVITTSNEPHVGDSPTPAPSTGGGRLTAPLLADAVSQSHATSPLSFPDLGTLRSAAG